MDDNHDDDTMATPGAHVEKVPLVAGSAPKRRASGARAPPPDEEPQSTGKRVLVEVFSLLKWSMLAACTIGPGTVIVCSKSGADFNLQLIWTLFIASYLACVAGTTGRGSRPLHASGGEADRGCGVLGFDSAAPRPLPVPRGAE